MEKFDPIKLTELVKVEDPDEDGGITLTFQENKRMKVKAKDGKLISDIIS